MYFLSEDIFNIVFLSEDIFIVTNNVDLMKRHTMWHGVAFHLVLHCCKFGFALLCVYAVLLLSFRHM